jgi:endonuclease YncB( thermonuclease family)
VEYDKYDRYRRVPGKVLLESEDVNLEQISAGLAWHYKKYQGGQSASDRVKYSDAELEARQDSRGLWLTPIRYRRGTIARQRGNRRMP